MKYQVVILAGGESSRFFPFNNIHKSFFMLDGKSVLEHTIESVKRTKPADIILVLGSKNFDREKEICNASPLFEGVTYACEEKTRGQADAILSAKEFIKDDFFVINASQFNFDLLAKSYIEMHESADLATVGIGKTETPHKYGIVDLEGERINAVIEKPEKGKEPSNMRIVGVYLFKKEFISELSKTPISDYSLEEALDRVAKDKKVGSVIINGTQPTLKYPWDILSIKDMVLGAKKNKIDRGVVIEKTAVLKGNGIVIEKGAHIYDFALLEGPCYIGKDAVIGAYCQIRKGTIIGEKAQIERYCDVKNSIIGRGTHIHSGFVGDSVIGDDCRIGASFITANKRLGKESVKVWIKAEKVDSGLEKLGVFIGSHSSLGIRVSAMPGTVLGERSTVFPGMSIKGTHESDSKIVE
ncbi:MAG: Nucleotidyl transferase [uncultured bacterium]|nr:MAG: Nucleotidyl transferase [uncultured bacterium]